MVAKLRLPFPLLSDLDAAVISAWDVYDPVGGTHGPIARPAIFAVGRDLRIAYEHVGRDFADRPPNNALYSALEQLRDAEPRPLEQRVRGPGPRPLDAGNPADRPMPLDDIPTYFRGATFAAQAIAGRTNDAGVKAEVERFRAIIADYTKAAVATLRQA